MVYTDAGEDLIAAAPAVGYAANLEKATSRLAPVDDLAPTGDGKPERIHTPGKAAIADIVAVPQHAAPADVKALAYMALRRTANGSRIAVFLRGDHSVNEAKLIAVAGARELRYMGTEELETWFKGPAGYLGPVGLTAAKEPLGDGLTMVARQGSRRPHQHGRPAPTSSTITSATSPRAATLPATVTADVRNAVEGEGCPNCGAPLKIAKAVEIGHIFKLG